VAAGVRSVTGAGTKPGNFNFERIFMTDMQLRNRLGLPTRAQRVRIWARDRETVFVMGAVVAVALVLAGALGEGLQRVQNVIAR